MSQFRHPPRQAVNGIVLLNKPADVSSNGILQQVRRIFNAKKAGHTGALDPFATGLLPICLGEATKVSGLLLDSDKRYTATLKLGERSNSGDTEGEIIEVKPVPQLSREGIEKVLHTFLGEIEQIPPMYSALKYQGKPLYWYARQGIEIERPARKIHILELQLISFNEHEIVFDVHCSKGTYVRTLGEDIAVALGTVGHLTALHRTQTGSLSGDDMLTIEQIEERKVQCLQPLDIALQAFEALYLDAEQTVLLQHGGKLALSKPNTELVRFYDPDGRCFGVGEWQEAKQLIKPKRLFNLNVTDGTKSA
ncbi:MULTISPECIES: tRNA pseudouridine(55) synthase TruB [Thiomicrorhabdus]|uniref:tRNA pseudouridine synthase B n=1 Tax=Thiomicrorhabdus heinhorstiae TaxID=2748010 RepID=A0ABS0BSZ7_9GAMM|nr:MULTISPECIES: tRNA pseudouridine(55) synthase TruB [Thiomicrorhabdus]MBF6056958.1 tRNA pseudouridine(55) synthase TruB [Thiomicrorhabdus heinhorstiae]